MAFSGFSASATTLLAELAQNNNHEWFHAKRAAFEELLIAPGKELVVALGERLRELDPELRAVPRVRGSIKAFELRRRFQQRERAPYNEHLDIWFWSGPRREWDNSGFFLRLSAARLVLAGGMIEFQKEALARYRECVVDEERGAALSGIVHALRAGGYVVGGESYKQTPRGIAKDSPRAALARHSGIFATLDCPHPPELATPEFVHFCFAHFARMNALHGWLVAMQNGVQGQR
ncbi:MAG TPA: DUF2461 family protein [Polyangiaceae bacterium]|nr:DUF2461 family protein [Polyangiaceae bacterium]